MKRDFVEERRQKIVEYVNKKSRADISELAELFSTTEATIRRDLITLESQKLVARVHGGVMKRRQPALWQTTLLDNRIKANQEEKTRIAEFVVEHLIHDGESLMIDAGSTTLAVASALIHRKNLLAVTNSPRIGELLSRESQSKVILTGGELLKETAAMIGSIAEHSLMNFRTDKAIIGVSGLIEEEGCFSAVPHEAEVKRIMSMNASETIIVADSSKIGVKAFCLIGGFENIDKLVTDSNIDSDALKRIKDNGIEVFTV
jgi:DeoR family transcriptional regulator, fructose operon transcriptional repressor